jgi:predicted membrane protein (TIGR00267 family)
MALRKARISHDAKEAASHGASLASEFGEIILGGQDGVVNVLGVVLGVAAGTNDIRAILVAGAAATFAESISMAAVAYTSTRAEQSFHESMRRHEMAEIKECASCEKDEVRAIYKKKGFTGRLLDQIVNHITRNKKLWTETMMTDELGLSKTSRSHPYRSAFVVGGSAVVGSLIPMIPFIFMSIPMAVVTSLVLCSLTLFITGSYNAKLTVGVWWQRGLEMMIIGMLAALVGYGVGAAVGAVV